MRRAGSDRSPPVCSPKRPCTCRLKPHAPHASAPQSLNGDCCLAIGGGSTIGLGKAIALESPLPIVAVPTTYAGSEMTPIYGLTEAASRRQDGIAVSCRRPCSTIPTLTLSLPPQISGPSGMNAIAHCVEGLYAEDANPLITPDGRGRHSGAVSLAPDVVRQPENLDARSDALYGAWLGGTALGAVGMAIHHKLCHTLGGSFNLPHAEVHTVILPHATAFNRDAAPEAMRLIADALGTRGRGTGPVRSRRADWRADLAQSDRHAA